jgi:integrase/recombinase XerD
MNDLIPIVAASPLRQRLIDDMTMRRFSRETQRNYLRDVGRFSTWLRRSPHTATAEDVRRFQIEQQEAGVPVPTMNSVVAALRFFFTHSLDRPELARKLVRTAHARKIPVVLSLEELKRLLEATTCLKHQAALSVAYGAGLRVAEVAALKVSDIDSERMLLRIERGKVDSQMGHVGGKPASNSDASVSGRVASTSQAESVSSRSGRRVAAIVAW